MAERFSFCHVEAIAGADLRDLRACMCPMCMGAKGPCKVKQIIDIKKIWIELTPPTHPTPTKILIFWGFSNFVFSIQNGPGSTHPLPNFFWLFGIFLTLQHPSAYTTHAIKLILGYIYIYRNYADP